MVQRELSVKVIVFVGQDLFIYICINFGCEVENGIKIKIMIFVVLVVFVVFDLVILQQGIYISKNIFVQMQIFLSFGYIVMSCYENIVEEIRVIIVQFVFNLCYSMGEESIECLFFIGGNVIKDINVFRENVFVSIENGNRGMLFIFDVRGVGGNVVGFYFFKFCENVVDFEIFFEVVVLVGINELDVFVVVEDKRVVLIVGFVIIENGVVGELNVEFGVVYVIFYDFGVFVYKSGVKMRFFVFVEWRFFVQIGDLQVGISMKKEFCVFYFFFFEFGKLLYGYNKFEFLVSYVFEFMFEFV